MEKYFIVLDLDETLLHSDKTISEYSKAILKKCQDLGCKIQGYFINYYRIVIFLINEHH